MLTRFSRRADALLFVGASLFAAAVSVVAAGGSLGHIGKTFPGFVVWDNLVVVALGRSTWTGIRAAVPFRARVASVDGRPVARHTDIEAVIRAASPGTPYDYVFETSRGTESRTVRSMVFTAADYATTLAVYLLNGLAFVAVGLVVFYLKPDSRQSRALLAFGVVWGLMLVLCVDLFTAARLDPLYFVMQGLCPAAVLHLALTFPEPRVPVKHDGRILAWVYAGGLCAGLAEVWLYRRSYPALLALDAAVWLTTALAAAIAMASIALSAVRGETPLARRRARVVLSGSLAAFLVPLFAVVGFFVLERGVSTSVLAATGFIFPLAIGYAIARHDLFEADRFVKLTVVYAALTALVSLSYAGTVLVAERLAAGLALTRTPYFPLAFVLLALATIVPLRDRVQRAVDRLFYRTRVDFKDVVAHASERMTTLLDRDAIVGHLLGTLRDVLFIERATLWERDGDTFVRRGADAVHPPRRLPASDPALALLERRARLLSRDEVDESPRLRAIRPALHALFADLDATLVVPLVRSRRLVGLLGVGPKASGGPLSADDVAVLGTLANETAVALANAAAVDQLRDAHERLNRSERLAAIGELSTAVAHGIRNPLAGIRLAAQLGLEHAGKPDDPVRENLQDVLVEVDKLEAQVRGILDFARPFEPRLEPTEVPAVVTSLLETLAPRLASGQVTAEFAAAAGLPAVHADRAHLGQALQELIVNAIEAMGGGGRLTISAAAVGNGVPRVEIVVADTGPGVPNELRERIFQLFATTKRTGTGVGLAVVRKIVERHGGTIRVESGEPIGTRFVVELPAAPRA